MENNAIPLLYLTGVLQVALSVLHSVPHVYHLILTPSSWKSAQTYCRANYVDLATVITSEDWRNFQTERGIFSSIAWVGLYNDVHSWRWSYDNTPLEMKKWAFQEPNNEHGNESCGALDTNGYWWDLDCTLTKPFLCYDASLINKFIGFSTVMSWANAQAYCRQHHTDLATSNSDEDNLVLRELVKGQWSAWFGLFRDTWKWSDQSNASSIDWLLGSPNNLLGNDNCGAFTVGYFDDALCTNLLPFFCHTIPPVRERQIVKLHVTSQQNMNSPAVETSILNLELKGNSKFIHNLVSFRVCLVMVNGIKVLNFDNTIVLWNIKASQSPTCVPTSQEFYVRELSEADIWLHSPPGGNNSDQIQQFLKAHKVLENAKLTWRLQPDGSVFQKIKKKTSMGNVTVECAVHK